MQRNHWDAYGTLDDLEVAERFNAKYPGEMVTPSRPGDVERHVYEWLSKLMTPAQVADALDEMRRREQDVSPYRQGSEDFFSGRKDKDVLPPPADGEGAEHAECDHYMPGGMVRHFHRVRSANNWGPPLPGDPYVGTGLDPINHTGIVAPNDGLPDEMACCGQRIPPGGPLPPGCWIAWEPQHREGKLHMYELWYQTQKPSEIWDAILQPNRTGVASLLQSLTRIGTAFLDLKYYQRLHDRIQRTLVKVLPTVIAFQNSLINHNFDTTQVQWLPDERLRINKLVALVDLYNAPQLGACFHRGVAITDEWIAETILHIGTGRALHKTNKLNFVVQVAGARIERVKSVAQVRTLVPVLRAAGASVTLLEDALVLVPDAENEQRLLEADVERLRVTLPELGASSVSKIQSLYKAAKDLANALGNLLENGLPGAVNTWLRENDGQDGSVGPEVVRAWADKMRAALTESREVHVTVRGAIEEAKHAAEADLARRRAEEAQRAEDKRRTKELKQREEEERRQRAQRDKELQKEDKERQKAEKKRADKEARKAGAKPMIQEQTDFVLPLDKNHAQQMERHTIVAWSGRVVKGNSHLYDQRSCPYDSFFAAMFKIPNQWFRSVVRDADVVHIPGGPIPAGQRPCTATDVLLLHNAVVDGIMFIEDGTREPQVCTLPSVWNTCLRTQDPNAPKERRRDDSPIALLSALAGFYRVKGKIEFRSVDEFPAPGAALGVPSWTELIAQGVPADKQLVVVEPVRPEAVPEGGEYQVPDTLGQYPLAAVLVFTPSGPHYEALVWDARQEEWVRFGSNGKAQFGAPSASVRTRHVHNEAVYFPAAWIFVRQNRMRPFTEEPVHLPSHMLSSNDWAMENLDLVRLFGGSYVAPGYLPVALNEMDEVPILALGIMPILKYADRYEGRDPSGLRAVFDPDEWEHLDPQTASDEELVARVDSVIIDDFLEPLVVAGRIGERCLLKTNIKIDLQNLCLANGLIYFDQTKRQYVVPYLRKEPGRPHPYLEPDTAPAVFIRKYMTAWAMALETVQFRILEGGESRYAASVEQFRAFIVSRGSFKTQIRTQ